MKLDGGCRRIASQGELNKALNLTRTLTLTLTLARPLALTLTLAPAQPTLLYSTYQARGKFDEWALGYLTHLVFRVLHRRGEDEGQASSYTVQVSLGLGLGLG